MTAISIIGSGLVTSLGFNSQSSCAAIRAGLKGLHEVNLWDAENGEYVIAAKVDLPHWWEGVGKLAELVSPAIWECLEQAEPERPESIPLLLGVAAHDRPHRLPDLDREILDEIEWRLQLPRNAYSAVFPSGNVSGLVALNRARDLLGYALAKCCVVAGVDSFLEQSVVVAYMNQRRIKTKSNSNGFTPGEAGSAVLVTRTGESRKPELKILGVGFGREPATIASTEPMRATGQVAACRNALTESGISMHEIAYRNTDLSGEHYKFKEAMLTQGRLLRQRVERQDIWHPAECVGEIGAAHAPCVLALSHYAGQKHFAPGSRCLCHFSGDGLERAACVVEFSESGEYQ
jgi:3-oxoacyl-[acyl-carrier-protein] synthase-1